MVGSGEGGRNREREEGNDKVRNHRKRQVKEPSSGAWQEEVEWKTRKKDVIGKIRDDSW